MRCAAQKHACEQFQQENRHLSQTLQELKGEHNRLKTVYGTVTQQLSRLHKYQGEMDAMSEAALTAKTVKAMNLKDEKDSLQRIVDEITEELEHQRIQVGIITVSR